MSQYLVNLSLWSPIKEACRGHRRQTNVCRMLKAYCAFIALLLGCSAGALGQSPTGQSPTESGSARRIILGRSRPREIPQATLSCTPEEATWWQELRKSAQAVQETGSGKKEKQRFLDLLHEGQDKSYQPPIPDSRPVVLHKFEPGYSEKARRKGIQGTVSFVVELRPDGFVGEVEINQGLGYGLDENVAEAARKTIFLPAIKDRKFVSFRMPMIMTFNIY